MTPDAEGNAPQGDEKPGAAVWHRSGAVTAVEDRLVGVSFFDVYATDGDPSSEVMRYFRTEIPGTPHFLYIWQGRDPVLFPHEQGVWETALEVIRRATR